MAAVGGLWAVCPLAVSLRKGSVPTMLCSRLRMSSAQLGVEMFDVGNQATPYSSRSGAISCITAVYVSAPCHFSNASRITGEGKPPGALGILRRGERMPGKKLTPDKGRGNVDSNLPTARRRKRARRTRRWHIQTRGANCPTSQGTPSLAFCIHAKLAACEVATASRGIPYPWLTPMSVTKSP
jgi:hypothetical protein